MDENRARQNIYGKLVSHFTTGALNLDCFLSLLCAEDALLVLTQNCILSLLKTPIFGWIFFCFPNQNTKATKIEL